MKLLAELIFDKQNLLLEIQLELGQ